jgi:hypothetical protein
MLIELIALAIVPHFECKDNGDGLRPYYRTANRDFPPLGQNAMASTDECDRAVAASNAAFGVICSRTGLDGWKPTLHTGTVPGRPDFGYLGGSSIFPFEDCLKATAHSGPRGVCFWGGSDWYVSPIDREGVKAGPFRTLDECVATTQ